LSFQYLKNCERSQDHSKECERISQDQFFGERKTRSFSGLLIIITILAGHKMKRSNVQSEVFGERKDFESGETDSSFQTSTKSIRGLNSDDVTFGVFKTSNKALGIKAGQSCGPVDGPSWRQTYLEPSKKAITQDQIDLAMSKYKGSRVGKSTGTEVLNSAGTTRRIQEAKVRAEGYGPDLSEELADLQQKQTLQNLKVDLHPYTGKPMKQMKSVSTGKPVDAERDSKDQRKRFALHRANAKHNKSRNKYLRALKRTESPKTKGITGFGVSEAEYKRACSQVGEHAVADRELRRFVPDHNRSWNKAGLRNPVQTHKQKQV